jgi:hypothetical protein
MYFVAGKMHRSLASLSVCDFLGGTPRLPQLADVELAIELPHVSQQRAKPGAPVIFQEVVHSIGNGEADCDEQSSFPRKTEWTSTRMPDLPFGVESNWRFLFSPATLAAPPHGAFW